MTAKRRPKHAVNGQQKRGKSRADKNARSVNFSDGPEDEITVIAPAKSTKRMPISTKS